MPNCKKCNSYFPYSTRIEGKRRNLKNRKYCLVCSPFKKHNTSKIHKIKTNGDKLVCLSCDRKYVYSKSGGHTKTNCNACVTKRSKKRLKSKAIKYCGGACKICGYDKCSDALCFHHIDPNNKEFGICGSTLSWDTIKKELNKCVLLCVRCHAEVHAKLISLAQ